jgi:4-hydroxybenzoate polyprenyltransferase
LSSHIIESGTLCVDFDGTFVRIDSLHELLSKAAHGKPNGLAAVAGSLASGKAAFKTAAWRELGPLLRPELFPRSDAVMELIASARAAGKKVELVSAAHQDLLDSVPGLSEIFDSVIGSRDGLNLGGDNKAKFLKERHPDGFAYVGNSAADLPVWAAARERFAVNLPASLRAKASSLGIVDLGEPQRLVKALVRSMRLHQWSKNLLIFVPMALTLGRLDVTLAAQFVAGFVLFGLMVSGTYIVNDLSDIDADRNHPVKRNRPLASGALPIAVGAAAAGALIVGGLLGAFLLKTAFGLACVAYLALTLAYTFMLKRLVLLDVMTIAALFTLRIVAGVAIAGGAGQGVTAHWLLNFSGFFFASLAFMKREAELITMAAKGRERSPGRDYRTVDQPLIMIVGVGLGIASLVIFALFISENQQSAVTHYSRPELLWIAHSALGYLLLRLWLKTQRGQMTDDPIVFALKDRASIAVGAVSIVSAALAQVL